LNFLTDFADQAVMLPVAVAVGVVLLLLRRRRAAVAWVLAVLVCFGLVGVLKMGISACAPPGGLDGLRSPSGHTVSAAMVYGGLIPLLGGGVVATVLGSTAFAVLFGASRLILGVHTVADVLTGGAIGIVGATTLAGLHTRAATGPDRMRVVLLLLAPVALLAALLHGIRLPIEPMLHHDARLIWPLSACHRGG
jgi:membrane-associated phospholipid phosphatase